jgi:transcription elongation factor GreA-like protein
MKKEPTGVPFNLFSDSLNMKILLSDLFLFTIVKVFEENVRWVIVYHFFGLVELFYKKGTERVHFKCFSDSINMKNPRFFFLWTHKKNIERPTWDQITPS